MSDQRWAGRISPPDLTTFIEIIDLRDLKWFLKRHWMFLAIGAVLGAGAGFVYTYFFPARFHSEAKVRFMPPQLAGRFVNPNFSMEVEQRLFALTQLLSSRLTASRLIDTFQLYPERRRFQTVTDLVPVFVEDLAITQISSDSDGKRSVPTLQIRYRYPNGEQAQKVVQKLVEQIYEENRKYRGDQSMGTTEFLSEQLRNAEEKMLEAEARYGEVQDALRPNTPRTLLGESTSRSYVVDSRLRDLRRDRRLLEERRNMKQAEVVQIEAEIKGIDARPLEYYTPQVETMPNFWNLYDREATARTNAVRMRDRWKPGFADRDLAELDLREASQSVEKFRREQAQLLKLQERDRVLSKLLLCRTELRAYDLQEAAGQKEELELRAEAQRLKDQNAAPAGMEADLLTARREYETAREAHTGLLRKHEESVAASDMERRGQGETVELLEPPSLPSAVEPPPRWARVALGGVAGLGLVLLICLLKAVNDPKILHEGHLEKWAGLEVLAMFPAAALGASRKKASPKDPPPKQTWRRRATATAVVLLALLSAGCGERFLSAETFWKRGQQAEKEGKPAAALLHYRQAIRKDPRFAPAYKAAGMLALQQGEILEAREFMTRALEFDKNDPDLYTKLGDLTYQIYFGDPGRPMTLLREVEAFAQALQTRWPRRADGYRLHAHVLMERHHTEEAVTLLHDAAAKVDNSETLDCQAAAALFRLGRAKESEALLRELLGRSPLYTAPYDLLYLQLMQRKDAEGGRVVLEQKWKRTSEIDAALQLAAHDDAFGRRDAARQTLEALEIDKASGPLALARIGDFWMHRGEYVLAQACYTRGRERHPERATDYISRIAEWYMAQNKHEEAKQYVAKALAERPKDLILQTYSSAIAITDVRAGQRAEERRKLESILQQLPGSPFVRYHLGRAYLMDGAPKAAMEQFERCVTLDANYAPGWVALAELEIARGNPAAAEQRAEAILRMDPNHLPANLVRAKAQVSRGKALEAEKTLEHLSKLQPGNTDVLYLLGSAQAAGNKPDKALALFEKGRMLTPSDARWILAEAEVLGRRDGAAAARKKLESAVSSGVEDETLLTRLASVQIAMQDGHAAVKTFEKLLGKNPDSLDYRLGQAGAYALGGDRQKALTLFSEIERLHPQHAPTWLQHAALLSEMKDQQGALNKYQEALVRDKNNPMILNNLAWLLLESGGSAEKALEYSLQARRTFGRSAEIDDTLATAYVRLAMYRNAAAIYEEMLTYVVPAERSRIEKLLAAAKRSQAQKKGEA